MKVIDYIELLSYGKYNYYDTKFSINNTGIKGNFTMNDFCQRLALTEEVLNMEIEIIGDTPNKIDKIKLTNGGLTIHKVIDGNNNDYSLTKIERTIIYKINEIIDKINGE